MANFVISEDELEEFKRDYCSAPGGKYDIEIQLPHLAKLADGYLNKYKMSGDWTDVLKAHALYNSCAVRAQVQSTDEWDKKAFTAQTLYWGADGAWDFETQQHLTTVLKDRLNSIRAYFKSELAKIDGRVKLLESDKITNEEFINCFQSDMKSISLQCTNNMVDFAKTVFEFSVSSLISQPPCAFCVVAIGSMAKGEATPYSDLEYMFLIERKGPGVVEYFKKLAVSSYFIIGNLKETTLDHLAIDELQIDLWFDDKQINGFKIDGLKHGAGNIPTGNGEKEQKNHLIVTPSELLERYKKVLHKPKHKESKRGDLTAMLQYTELVYSNSNGGKRLLQQFCERRDMLKLNQRRVMANTDMFVSDANKYGFKPTEELIEKGFSINTKKELYRYPSILLNNLAIIFGVRSANSWETLDILWTNNVISNSVHTSVYFILACACYFRLSIYLSYDSAEDSLSVLPTFSFATANNESSTSDSEKSGKRWFLSQSLFNLHCDYAVPLKQHLATCKTHNDIKCVVQQEVKKPCWLLKLQMYYYCNMWSQVQGHFQDHFDYTYGSRTPEETIKHISDLVEDFHELWHSVKALTHSLCELRRDGEALSYHLGIQKIIENGGGPEKHEEKQLILADSKAKAAYCYYGLTMYEESASEYSVSLDIRRQHLPENYELLANMHLSVGRSYNLMYRYREAEVHLTKALHLCYTHTSRKVDYDYYHEVIYSPEHAEPVVPLPDDPKDRLQYLNNSSMILAHIIWTLGLNYFYSKYYERSFHYFEKGLAMFFELYGNDACHRDIANIFYALGCACSMLGCHDDTDKYFKRCLHMSIQIYESSREKSKLFTLMKHVFLKINYTWYLKAVVHYCENLPRFKVAHAQSAAAMNRLGLHFVYTKQHKLADWMLKKALNTYRNASSDRKYSSGYISNTIANIALNAWKSGNVDMAERLYLESLTELEGMDKTAPKARALERGEILQSMGVMYEEQNNYGQALRCYNDAKANFDEGCNDPVHPKILEIELQIQSAEITLSKQWAKKLKPMKHKPSTQSKQYDKSF